MAKSITSRQFLGAHKITKNIYVTGLYYSGITIYNQQIRTLNLIFFLRKNGIITPPQNTKKKIIIIGAGIAGITAAFAFIRLGYSVTIVEEKSMVLHLQHGCTTRFVHPNLHMWPTLDFNKPFTELPFGNWEAGSAGDVEKKLSADLEKITANKNNKLKIIFNSENTSVLPTKDRVRIKKKNSVKELNYLFLLLATGFGLEKYVGKEERTKSYWRNEDLAQLRLRDQVDRFFVSGTGDGAISDICRLTLLGFDPIEWSRRFEAVNINNKNLLDELRKVELKSRPLSKVNYYSEFKKVYNRFKDPLRRMMSKYYRSDIKEVILNGKPEKIETIFNKGNLLYFNAWMVYILYQENRFKYHCGAFPSVCGDYIYPTNSNNEYYTILRHGIDRNVDQFQKLNAKFLGMSKKIGALQALQSYNDYSTQIHWPLEFWTRRGSRPSKFFFVSQSLQNLSLIFLRTVEGIINNYINEKYQHLINYRLTVHRLVSYSNRYYFQQMSKYVGNRQIGEAGRAFPIEEGIVGLAMRSSVPYTLVKKRNNRFLFQYSKIFATPLDDHIKSFFVIPIPSKNRTGSVICVYFDSQEKILVTDLGFRNIMFSSITNFVKQIEEFNFQQTELGSNFISKQNKLADLKLINNTPGIASRLDEIERFQSNGSLIMQTNKLIDIYVP